MQHQIHSSEGDPGDTVVLTDLTIINLTVGGTCSAGIKVDADRTLYRQQANGGWSAISGEWLMRGVSSDFYVSMSVDSGSLTLDAGAGPLQLNTDRIYNLDQVGIGSSTVTITLSISDDVSGSPVVASAQFTFSPQVDSNQ